MLDTLMALWNRGYARKGLKFLLPFTLIGFCLILVLATEFVPARSLSAEDEQDLEEEMSTATPTQIISWPDEKHVIIILTPPPGTPTREVATPSISQIVTPLPQLPPLLPPTQPIVRATPGKIKPTPTPTHPVQRPTPPVTPEPTGVVTLPPPQPTVIVLLTPTSSPSPIAMPPIDSEESDESTEESEP